MDDTASRLEYFKNKVLGIIDQASFKETSSGVGQSSAGERGESSSPTVDLVVSPVDPDRPAGDGDRGGSSPRNTTTPRCL